MMLRRFKDAWLCSGLDAIKKCDNYMIGYSNKSYAWRGKTIVGLKL